MTATPTPLRELARDIHHALCDDGLTPESPRDNNAMRETILRVLSARDEADGEDRARKLYEPDEYEDAFKGRATPDEVLALLDHDIGVAKRRGDIAVSVAVEVLENAAALIRRLAAVAPAGMDGMAMVPRHLTAENGAKAALIGEFSFRDGSGREHDVPWHVIKQIHRRVVETFAAPTPPATAGQE